MEEEGAEGSKMSEAGRVHHNRVGTGCCRGTAEGGSTVVAGNTAVAGMAIHITTIKLGARRADCLPACIVKEEGIITEGGSTVKVEG